LRVSVQFLGTLAIAAFLRFSYLDTFPIDRLWESYSRWLIDVLTVRNSWIYAPQLAPNAAMGWLPFFQYLSMTVMVVSSNFRIEPLRLTNMALGLLTIAVLYMSVWRVFKNHWQATVCALFLAIQPWHIDYSTTGSDRILLGLLIVAISYAMLTGRVKLFSALAILTMLTAYEGWFIVPLEIVLGLALRQWTLRHVILLGIISSSTAVLWVGWNAVTFGSAFYFIASYLQASGYVFKLDTAGLTFYLVLATVMTFGLFLIGLGAMLLRKSPFPSYVRALAVLIAGYVGLYSVAHYFGFDAGDLPGRLVPILPIVALSVSFAFPTVPSRRRRQLLVGIILLAMLMIPYYAQTSIGPKKVYVIPPEQRVGYQLRALYHSGRVICDLPAVIYYSELEPGNFVSSSSISWYAKNLNATSLERWFDANQITFVVWQNITASPISEILPMLGASENYEPPTYVVGSLRFQLVYEDSFATGHWEHDPSFAGPPPIFVFQVEIQP